jgi:UDP-glucose 4-epimerase
MVYGPAQRDVKKLVPYTILSLLRGIEPQIGSGVRQVDWIFVEDVVRGLLALSQAPNIEGDTVSASGSSQRVRMELDLRC